MKKQMILSAVFGVILFGFGFANFAMAGNNPIPGVDIIVRSKPGGIAIQVKTGADGTYKFTGLAPGTYDLIIPGQPVKLVTVSTDGTLGGKLMHPTGSEAAKKGGANLPGKTIQAPPASLLTSLRPIAGANLPGKTIQAPPIGPVGPPESINPIPGVDIIVRSKPGGIAIQVKTGADGTYKFTGLAPGTYDLATAGQPPQLVIVGSDGTLGGKLMKGTDGVVKLSCATGNHIKAK